MNYQEVAARFNELVDGAQTIVVMQADNPDGDSLASALALESLLGSRGKNVILYGEIDVPEHLRYLEGWDRIQKDFPNHYDLAIVVDCGVWKLFGHFERNYGRGRLDPAKLIVIDEHAVEHSLEAALDIHDHEAVSSGNIIYELCSAAGFTFDKLSATFIASSILSDTLGFTSEVMLNRPRPFEIMAKLMETGVDLSELQEKRLEHMRISAETLHYKGELLQRVEYFDDGRIASITIPYDEIRDRSQEFNPTVVLDETRLVDGVAVTIGFKQYERQGNLFRVTGRIRCNRGYSIADKLAQTFEDGGGHPYASGFKVEGNDLNFEEIKQKVITEAIRLLADK